MQTTVGLHKPQKNTLEIRLTEPVVFLRNGDAAGRHRHTHNGGQGSMVRGLLTLRLIKPTRISKIEVELTCKSNTSWPEGVGARRVDVTEEHKLYEQSHIFFDANAAPVPQRRTLSVGPGLSLGHDHGDDSHSDEQSRRSRHPSPHDPDSDSEQRGRELTRGRGRAPRYMSVNAHDMYFQPHFVNHFNDQMPTPPYTPRYQSPERMMTPSLSQQTASSLQSPIGAVEETPERTPASEDLRSALRRGLHLEPGDYTSAIPPSSSGMSSPSHFRSRSRNVSGMLASATSTRSGQSIEGELTDSPNNLSPHAHSPREASHSRAPSPSPHAPHHEARGRHTKRFSLASVSTAIFEALTDRVRPASQHTRDSTPLRDHAGERTRDATRERAVGRSRERRGHSPDTRHERHKGTLGRVGEVLGLESEDHHKGQGDGWKEFKPGVYTYPISFSIPINLPPSLICEYGRVHWRLRAHAHRPGTFTSKLSAVQEVTVVVAPGEDDTEDTENIVVERQWEEQMQYQMVVSGRSFPIGGSIPITVTFVPWTKAKVFRITAVLEERVEYLSQHNRIARTDGINRINLFSLSAGKDAPLLPLQDGNVESFLRSPLHILLGPNDDPSELASNYMGPGPWTIQHNIPLPDSCATLHFTNKNKRSNIIISHLLRITFRVQRGDDVGVPAEKRKLFDIVVQTPIHILSCLCSPDYTSLPPYSTSSELRTALSTRGSMCGCRKTSSSNTTRHAHRLGPSSSSRGAGIFVDPSHHYLSPPHSQMSSPRREDVYDRSTQFERLMTGQETESGEAPPAYEAVALVATSSVTSSVSQFSH